MHHPELPVFAFLSALLVLIPLPWHLRARNIATVSIVVWLFAVNMIYGINSILWADNVDIKARVWCDISTKIVVGASFALPLATMCICKHLEMVASTRMASYNSADRRRRMIFEASMCFGLPLIFMALHFVVQGHRFDLFENTGCQAAVYISVPAIMIIYFPQLLFSCITMIYAGLALYHFLRRRLIFAAHLQHSNSSLTTRRYLSLFAMAVTLMTWGTVFTSYNLYNNVIGGLRPWTTWSDVHSNFSRIAQYPDFIIPPQFLAVLMLFWWTMPASSLIFFGFFGFGEEAQKEYRKLWNLFKTKILRIRSNEKSDFFKISFPQTKSDGSLPLNKQLSKSATSIDKTTISSPTSTTSGSQPDSQPPAYVVSTPLTLNEACSDSDTFTFTTMSIYDAYSASLNSASVHTPFPYGDGERHVALPELSPMSSSHRSQSPDVPESVGPLETFPKGDGISSPRPVYHRPFSPPSIYPATRPHQESSGGILVTIHRQASADEIV